MDDLVSSLYGKIGFLESQLDTCKKISEERNSVIQDYKDLLQDYKVLLCEIREYYNERLRKED